MIYLNQTGYLPFAKKTAFSTLPGQYKIISTADEKSVLEGELTEKIDANDIAGEYVYRIEFDSLTREGEYYIRVGNTGSFPFRIGNEIYAPLLKDSIRCLYYQRCGMTLPERFAGRFAHPSCHTAKAFLLKDYLEQNTSAETFDVSGGWHDAGDYGRYTSAASVALGHLLYSFELFGSSFEDTLDIPESGNDLPDILNECLYELNWLLKMQAPDGSAYHKVTTQRHVEFIMPEDDLDTLIIFPASSYATADFAAVMALAFRIYKPYIPEFAYRALDAAKKAYEWLSLNPFTDFSNPEGFNTGLYKDKSDIDERLWANAEMLRADPAGSDRYIKIIRELSKDLDSAPDFGWEEVSGMAALSILTDPSHNGAELEPMFKDSVLAEGTRLLELLRKSPYDLAMENADFVWGSNMVVLNRAMLFILCSRLLDSASSDKYTDAAMEHLHYILGRNPMNISYVTGYGANAFKNPHARVTSVIGGEPMPGWVSGGPFRNFCDATALGLIPKGTAPMKCYVDEVGSYSTNEITIYWNSPLVFVCAFLCSYVLE